MEISRKTICFLTLLIFLTGIVGAQEKYKTAGEVETTLKELASSNPQLVKMYSIGKSFGGKDIWVVRVAADGKVDPDKRQGMFIGANIEGYKYLATEAGLRTVKYLVENKSKGEVLNLLKTRTYYIAPLLNPDVYARVGTSPSFAAFGNDRKVNDDLDLKADEDGPDDLNGDGIISYMRYKDPEGAMIVDPDDDRLMIRVDPIKGIRGEYKVIYEGIDNDKDGLINEDGPGGVVINRNFPHDYKHYTRGAGEWSASEPETIAILDFMIARKNIGMVYLYGSENNLINLVQGKGKQRTRNTMRVPSRYARFMNLDPGREYPVDELIQAVKAMGFNRGGEVTAESLAIMFGGGPAKSISSSDFAYYKQISDEYKKSVGDKKLDDPKRKAKAALGNGSFVTWAYFQHGVPSFTVDLWAIPTKKAAKEQEKTDPGKSKNLRRGEIMDWARENLPEAGFVAWTKFQHPTLGEVEIGGMKPLLGEKPPLEGLDEMIAGNVEFAVSLAARLPEVEVVHYAANKLSDGVFEVTAIIGNKSFLPTSMAQGQLNKKIYPVVVNLGVKTEKIFHGTARVSIGSIKGYAQSKKLRWVISGKAGDKIPLEVITHKCGNAKTEITLK